MIITKLKVKMTGTKDAYIEHICAIYVQNRGHSPVHQSPDTQVMDGVMGSCFLKDIVKGEQSVLTDNHLWHITHNGRAHLTQVNFLTDILWPNAGKIHKEHPQTCTKYGLSLVYQVIRNSCKKQVLNKIVECCKNCAF